MSLFLTSLATLMVASAPSPVTGPAFAADSTPTTPAPATTAPAPAPAQGVTPSASFTSNEMGVAADTSIHIDMAIITRLADVNKKMVTTIAAHPYDSLTVVKAVQDVQSKYPGVQPPPEKMLSAQLATNSGVVGILKESSFTPESYSRSMISLQITWAVVSLRDQLAARGISPTQVNLPATVPANLEFVKAHVKDLTSLGFTPPNATINTQGG